MRAKFCQRAICQNLREEQGECLFSVKANQPELMGVIKVPLEQFYTAETLGKEAEM